MSLSLAIIALLFLLAGYHLIKTINNECIKTSATLFIVAITGILLLSSQDWFRGFLKTQFLGTIFNASKEAGKKLEEFSQTTENMKKQLENNQQNIIEQQDEISVTQESLNLTQQKIDETAKNLQIQQDNLTNIEDLIKNIFERKRTIIYTLNQGKMFYTKQSDQLILIFFELPEIPIYETVDIQYHVYTQPPGSYKFYNNIVVFRWGDSESKIKSKNFYISYIADPEENKKLSTLTKKGKVIYFDDRQFDPKQ